MKTPSHFSMLKIPRKRLVRNVRLALGFAKTRSGRGSARFNIATGCPCFTSKLAGKVAYCPAADVTGMLSAA